MRGRRIVRVIFSLISDGGAFPSRSSSGTNMVPGGGSGSSGCVVARNGASLGSPRHILFVGLSAVFGQNRSAKAQVEAMAAMTHRATLIAVRLFINTSCERNQE